MAVGRAHHDAASIIAGLQSLIQTLFTYCLRVSVYSAFPVQLHMVFIPSDTFMTLGSLQHILHCRDKCVSYLHSNIGGKKTYFQALQDACKLTSLRDALDPINKIFAEGISEPYINALKQIIYNGPNYNTWHIMTVGTSAESILQTYENPPLSNIALDTATYTYIQSTSKIRCIQLNIATIKMDSVITSILFVRNGMAVQFRVGCKNNKNNVNLKIPLLAGYIYWRRIN